MTLLPRIVLAALASAAALAPSRLAMALDPPHDGVGGCSLCHVPHGGPLIDKTETLCRSCHYSGGPATEVLNHTCTAGVQGCRFTFGPGTASPVWCVSCHDPHEQWQSELYGSTVSNYVRAEVRTPGGELRDVVFTAVTGPSSYADGDATFDGICEVCHTQTDYHRNTASGGWHYAADACRTCHAHTNRFKHRSCTACHMSAQGSRRVIAPGGGAGTADFDRASHHVQSGVRNRDCTTCHDHADHRSGTVNLRDPDGAAVLPYSDGASLEPVCLGCHDANGAAAWGGTTPLTSRIAVPDIAGRGWAASAHATGGSSGAAVTCYGSGTGGCHANAHGSNLPKLGAPYDADLLVDPTAGEEALCFRCHTSGGVVNEPISSCWVGGAYASFGSDVEAAFFQASVHPVADSAAGHSFTIGGVPRELECTSCHGVHEDTGRYWAAPSGVTPVVDPWTRSPWGDGAPEKIATWDPTGVYQPPSLGEPGLDLSGRPLPIDPSGASLLTGTVRPNYVSFCLSCHQSALTTTRAIDWSTSKHGSVAAEPVGALGSPLAAPWVDANRGVYFLDCLDCHEAHGSALPGLLRPAANGTTVTVSADPVMTLMSFCERCHPHAPRHHDADVQAKVGSSDCMTCHAFHGGGGMYTSCLASGCHNHGEWF